MNKNITRMKLGESLGKSQTDWNHLRQISDEEIDCSDIPELDETFWKNAKLVTPQEKKQLTIRLDSDIVDWFKEQGSGYQTRINAVLKSFCDAHKNK